MSQKQYKHLFFDLDNTLWDFRKNSHLALEQMYQEKQLHQLYGVSFDKFHAFYYEINEKLWADLRDEKITKAFLREQRFLQSFQKVGIDNQLLVDYFESEYLNRVTQFNHLVEGTIELLEYLAPHYQLHILSNGFEEVTLRKINQSELKGYFKTITSADEVNLRKPNPIVFKHALDKANAQKHESLYMGDDWIADVIGCRDFGIDCIFYNPLKEKHEPLDSLIEVFDLVDSKKYL